MNRTIYVVFLGATLSLITAVPARAGCWECRSECCEEAARGTTGKDLCRNDNICAGNGCTCNDCWASGSSCAGTAEPECDSPLNVCEQHQTFLIVPHGESIDFSLLTPEGPPMGAKGSLPGSGGTCRDVV